MKTLFFLLLSFSFLFSQSDTISVKPGKPGGFKRIRHYYSNGKIKTLNMVDWRENGGYKKICDEYNIYGTVLSRVDSTFDNNNNLIVATRYIGDTIENERSYYKHGKLRALVLSLYLKGKYTIFQKEQKDFWSYYILIDGNPPQKSEINKKDFDNAETLFIERYIYYVTYGASAK